MKRIYILIIIIGVLLAARMVMAPAPSSAQDLTDVAAIKMRGQKVDEVFLSLHTAFMKRDEQPIGVLFVGDSITQGWLGTPLWKTYYGPYNAANFGIGGDRTQHVLWRIEHGELDNIFPKVVVLMIGTNNIDYPASQISLGVKKVIEEIHQKLPNSQLLLLGILPRGSDAGDPKTIIARNKIKAVNAELMALDDGKKTRYLDMGDKFLDAKGNIPQGIMPDGLHPNAKGYQIWGDAMQPLLNEMMAQ
jgi:beta-glucosidase